MSTHGKKKPFLNFFSPNKNEETGGNNPLVHLSAKRGMVEIRGGDSSVPTDFICPISLQLMHYPVLISTGHTYERSSIDAWFSAGNIVCPVTKELLTTKSLIPNYSLQRLIKTWCEKNGIKNAPKLNNSVCGPCEMDLIRNYKSDLLSADLTRLRTATLNIYHLAKRSYCLHLAIGRLGVIPPPPPLLMPHLFAEDAIVRKWALKSTQSVSLAEENLSLIVEANGLIYTILVLEKGSPEDKEKAAGIVCNLSFNPQLRKQLHKTVTHMVELFESGTVECQKRAANALLLLSSERENAMCKPMIRKIMVRIIEGNRPVEESLRIFDTITKYPEVCRFIIGENPLVLLLRRLSDGSETSQECAASLLHKICLSDRDYIVQAVSEDVEAQVDIQTLLSSGSLRAKNSAQSLLDVISDFENEGSWKD